MGSAREAIQGSLTFEALFDETTAVYGKEAFKEAVFEDLMSKGQMVEIDRSGDGESDMIVKQIDPQVSQMYNVFHTVDEYEEYLQQSLRDPSEEEIMEALRGARS